MKLCDNSSTLKDRFANSNLNLTLFFTPARPNTNPNPYSNPNPYTNRNPYHNPDPNTAPYPKEIPTPA